MKRRDSFVANSSSSSFIVVYRNLTPEEETNIFIYGVIPLELENTVECLTGKYLGEGYDVVYINNKTLPEIILNGLVDGFEGSAKVIVEYGDEDDYIIKPEHVGCLLMHFEKDYHSTNDDTGLLLARYSR